LAVSEGSDAATVQISRSRHAASCIDEDVAMAKNSGWKYRQSDEWKISTRPPSHERRKRHFGHVKLERLHHPSKDFRRRRDRQVGCVNALYLDRTGPYALHPIVGTARDRERDICHSAESRFTLSTV
jgi:hypothetical protein